MVAPTPNNSYIVVTGVGYIALVNPATLVVETSINIGAGIPRSVSAVSGSDRLWAAVNLNDERLVYVAEFSFEGNGE